MVLFKVVIGLFVLLVRYGQLQLFVNCEQSKPNFLFILVDDLGFNDIGYNAKNGESAIKTPFLDQLAKNGIKLENYYVHMVCTPTRGALLTGKYDIHTGLQHQVIKPTYAFGLPTRHKLMPERLKKCGYETHMVGKWHLGIMRDDFLPWNRGFDTFSGMLLGEADHYTRKMCHKRMCGYDWSTENGPSNGTFGEYSSHLYAKKAIRAIENRDPQKPFFLYLAFQAPHRPVRSPHNYTIPYKSYIKNWRRRRYAGMVSAVDDAIRNVVQYLEDEELLEDTIIVFSTDNGGEPKEAGNNWPLRGRKGTLWEGGVKAVGFIHGQRLKKSGVTHRGLVHVTDWFPTFLKAANCSMGTEGIELDGFDQWKTLTQESPSPRNEVLHTIDEKWRRTEKCSAGVFDTGIRAAIRAGPWKLLTGDPGVSEHTPPPESQTIHPIINTPLKSGAKLFHLENDPYELHDVADNNTEVVGQLLERLAFYHSNSAPIAFRGSSKQANPSLRDGFWGPWIDN